MPETKGQHFYGHLLSLQDNAFLLPKQAMLEAVSMETISEAGGPEWFLGFSDWHGGRIPAVSLEAMMGGEVPLRGRRTRMAIINSVGTHLPDGLFAIMTTAYPHLLPLNPAAVKPGEKSAKDDKVVLARVRLANRDAFVPDLEEIERRIAEVLAEKQSPGKSSKAGKSGDKGDKPAPSGGVDAAPLEEWEPSIDLGLPD